MGKKEEERGVRWWVVGGGEDLCVSNFLLKYFIKINLISIFECFINRYLTVKTNGVMIKAIRQRKRSTHTCDSQC